jgi:Zn-dependent protease with chaperone function
VETLKEVLETRVRNQISNVILFGSVIGLTATGLVAGATAGTLLVGRTSAHAWMPVFQLLTVVLATVAGFSAGVFASLLVSPLVLRFAFFATPLGEWNGIAVHSAADEDLPGHAPNVFVAGFSFGIGALRPAIFVSEGAIRALSRDSLVAVFAHEISHLECRHLAKRVVAGVASFLAASFLTAIMLIGLHWSGYAEIGGIFSAISGVVPAVLTWMTIRQMIWRQELEADRNAIARHGVAPEALFSALETLQRAIGGNPHPLVAARMEACRSRIMANDLTHGDGDAAGAETDASENASIAA